MIVVDKWAWLGGIIKGSTGIRALEGKVEKWARRLEQNLTEKRWERESTRKDIGIRQGRSQTWKDV